jgi:hypothetical protein
LTQLNATGPLAAQYAPVIKGWIAAMNRLTAIFPRLISGGWREISTAPFDREIELTMMVEDIASPARPCLRHRDGWLDAETLQPIEVAATHWRYRRPGMLPMACC